MKPVSLFLILFLTGCGITQAQQKDFVKYDSLVWSAMLAFKEKDFKKSLNQFNKAFQILDDDSADDYFYASAAALRLNDTTQGKKLMIQAIEKTNASETYLLAFEEFDPFRTLSLFEAVVKNFHRHQSNFYNSLEYPEIFSEIEKLRQSDQEVREIRSGTGQYSDVDSININRLTEITKQFGWQQNGWLLLWHHRSTYKSDNYIWAFFRPFINNGIAMKTIRPDFWARFDDEAAMSATGKQIYGTYWPQYDQYPIMDLDTVDSRRARIGMPPLWYMEKVYGFVPPKGYKS